MYKEALKMILMIEKKYGITLKQEDRYGYFNKNCYKLDDNGEVIALNLKDNEISDITLLKELKNLTNLDLSNNKISDITPLKELKNLTELYLFDNKSIDITPLKELKNLTTLHLQSNQIRNITPLKELKNLTTLRLQSNQIRDITPLKELKNLTNLDLSNNKISDITPLKELKNLTELYLWHNQISDISPLKELKNLKSIYLPDNQIKIFPEELLDLKLDIGLKHGLEYNISLVNNPIEEPPLEIMSQGNEAIREYFKRIREEGKRELNELKVIFIGAGGAGKTSLIKRVLDNEFDEKENKTDGIDIRTKDIEVDDISIKAHFWDFGAQEIMQSTHQFFLSTRCLYVIVLDSRKEDDVQYWLHFIQTFGGDSPVIIVLNKIDENPNFELNRKFLKDKYPNILDFYKLSCADSQGIDSFYDNLKKSFLKVELIKTQWIPSWFEVKKAIEGLKKNYIDIDEFSAICKEKNVNAESIKILTQYLDDLGTAIYFDDFELDDIHILNPTWITNGIYKLITSDKIQKDKGILEIKNLKTLLEKNTYPLKTHRYILGLMEKFEVCFRLDRETIMIPSIFDNNKKEMEFYDNNALQFELEYDFLPPSVISTFIVKSHKYIKDALAWKTGVILENKETKTLASVKIEKYNTVSIAIYGEQKRDFIAMIRTTLYDINSKFKKIEITQWILLPKYPKYRVKYKELIGYEKAGRDEYFNGELGETFSVSKLLNGIEKRESIDKYYYIDKYYQGDDMGHTFKAGRDITGVAIGNHNKIDVKITTTNNELKQLLQTFQEKVNEVVEILPEKDKKEFTQLTNQIIQDANDGEKSSFFDFSVKRLETFNKVTGFVESLGKIAEFLG